MKKDGNTTPTPVFLASLAVCVASVGMSVIEASSFASTADEPDQRMPAFAFARLIGDTEAEAEICSAPPETYESTLRDARVVLPEQYRKAGLNPDDIDRDVAKGKADILAMHQANPGWPSCDVFRRGVSTLSCWTLIIRDKIENGCPPLPPSDSPGWQDRIRSSTKNNQ